ncbi:Sec-independent protein translocase protein TatB [Psychrobacter sp. 1U2]|uniref:Sec-independent protein translocase protein TatB n=1 Tax=Psychrobacter sp. 1U2 TaxID=3453577 RepID=UPI003F454110
MFDIGFSELLLFGVIALIVLGPEKLPQAARTAGQWYGKIRRTVSTLQSEIEAELDLAETRQQMQKEMAKIRETEAQMKREMAEMRGSMQEFESAQNQSLKSTEANATDSKNPESPSADKERSLNNESTAAKTDSKLVHSAGSNYDYGYQKKNTATNTEAVDVLSTSDLNQPTLTRPWENMWFRLGAYDQARRLPAPPYLPNYKADTLLYSQTDEGHSAPHTGEANL